MLLRAIDPGWLAVTQPAHARLSAQLAAAWGAGWTAPVEPRDGVVAGTMLHDIGWLDWESSPTFNTETGLPHTFLELPIPTHIGMWQRASTSALAFGRYPALLTSLHGTRLYGSRDLSRLDPGDAALVAGFLADERQRQAGWIASLAADPTTAATVEDETLARNSQYVALWDAMSLAICGGLRTERTFQNAPAVDAAGVTLRLWPTTDADTLTLDPWPFSSTEVVVTYEGRFIGVRLSDERAMRDVLAVAPWRTVVVRIVPA